MPGGENTTARDGQLIDFMIFNSSGHTCTQPHQKKRMMLRLDENPEGVAATPRQQPSQI